MNVLVLFQEDSQEAEAAARILAGTSHTTQCEKAAAVLDGTVSPGPVDTVLVLAETYREREAREVCERVRETVAALQDVPLLVAVNVYQMPLANRVKELPNAHFVFRPIDPDEVVKRVRMLS